MLKSSRKPCLRLFLLWAPTRSKMIEIIKLNQFNSLPQLEWLSTLLAVSLGLPKTQVSAQLSIQSL